MLKHAVVAMTVLGSACLFARTSTAAEAAEEAKSPHSTTGNLTFATNYVFRGVSQTNFRPAVQGTYEYGHASGLYAGLFGSNVSWYGDAWEEAAPGQNSNTYGGATGQNTAISSSMEIDLYAGYRGKVADFGYDVGAIYYYYPGKYDIAANKAAFGVEKPNTAEVYGGVSWAWISAKLSYSVTKGLFGVGDARGSYYGELNATYPIGDTGVSLVGHVGFWRFNGAMNIWKANNLENDVYNLTDYKLGATADALGLTWGLFYWGSTAEKSQAVSVTQTDPIAVWGNRFGKNVGDDTVFLTVTKAF